MHIQSMSPKALGWARNGGRLGLGLGRSRNERSWSRCRGWYNLRNGGTERLRLVPDFTRIW